MLPAERSRTLPAMLETAAAQAAPGAVWGSVRGLEERAESVEDGGVLNRGRDGFVPAVGDAAHGLAEDFAGSRLR